MRCTQTARRASPAAGDPVCPWSPSPAPASSCADPDATPRRIRRAAQRCPGNPQAAVSFLALRGSLGQPALLGDLVLVEITKGLRDRVHRQRALIADDTDIVERHNPRQLRDVTR